MWPDLNASQCSESLYLETKATIQGGANLII